MKNEVKILIAAIVIILIILVAAYAISGSKSPQPTVTPTAQPTITPTPTPTPLASGTGGTGSNGGTSNPTPTPSISPTPTAILTPTVTPMPASGVELTRFGYWITYPPLGPENWSTNPPPSIGTTQQTQTIPVVQFKYDSGNYYIGTYSDGSTMNETNSFDEQTGEHNCEVNITLTRSTNSGSLSPDIIISDTNMSGYVSISQQPTFNDGQTTATLQVLLTNTEAGIWNRAYIYAYFSIEADPSSYSIGQNNPFYLNLENDG